MKQIEQYLKDNHFTAIESLKGGYCLDGKGGNLYTRLLNAMEEMMKDAYNEGIEAASKQVDTELEEHCWALFDKQSILKLKK